MKKENYSDKNPRLEHCKKIHKDYIFNQIATYGKGKKKKFKLRDPRPQGS